MTAGASPFGQSIARVGGVERVTGAQRFTADLKLDGVLHVKLVHLPVGRFAHAEEIAAGVLFLASDESTYVNATTFLIDGGLSGAYTTPL